MIQQSNRINHEVAEKRNELHEEGSNSIQQSKSRKQLHESYSSLVQTPRQTRTFRLIDNEYKRDNDSSIESVKRDNYSSIESVDVDSPDPGFGSLIQKSRNTRSFNQFNALLQSDNRITEKDQINDSPYDQFTFLKLESQKSTPRDTYRKKMNELTEEGEKAKRRVSTLEDRAKIMKLNAERSFSDFSNGGDVIHSDRKTMVGSALMLPLFSGEIDESEELNTDPSEMSDEPDLSTIDVGDSSSTTSPAKLTRAVVYEQSDSGF
eukprot:UN22618